MRRLIFLLFVLLITSNCLALQKNVASQKWVVFAFDETDNTAKTGDAGNITANLRIDGAGANAVDDTNPTELEDGYYVFDITDVESNGECIVICPDSSTANIQVIGCPMACWTTPANFPDFSVSATNGRVDIIKVAGTTQTANDMSGDINTILTDTEAQDSTSELRTLLTGADTPVAKDSTPLTAAEVEAEAYDALELANLDHWMKVVTSNSATLPEVVDDTVLANILTKTDGDTSDYDFTTHSFEALRDRGDSAWITAVAGLEVDLTKIHGSAITETTPGMFAANWDTFFDNADSATAKTLDDVGGASGGGSLLAVGAGNLGDYKEDATVYFIWRTIDRSGAADTPSTAGTIAVYKNNGTAQVTTPTGITDTRSFDSGDTTAGVHLVIIDTSANSFYEAGQDYSVVLYGAVIDTKTVTSVIATFSIEKRWTEIFWEYMG